MACRPNGADANDPRLAGALALVQRDAELRAWFEAEQDADAAIAIKLKAAPLPEGLLEQIRVGTQARIAMWRQASLPEVEGGILPPGIASASQSEFDPADAPISAEFFPQGWKPGFTAAKDGRRYSLTLALAACFALLGLIAALWLNHTPNAAPGSFAAYRTDMAQLVREFPKLDIATDRLPEVRQWLSQQHPLMKADLPKALEQFPSIGCRTVEWRGKKLALVCFMVEGQVVHLFVMPRNTFPDAGSSATPTFANVGSQNTASWGSNDNQYLLVTQADQAVLQKLL